MSHLSRDKTKLLGRVRRMKGQIEAIEQAIDNERDCSAVLHLVASVRGAMTGLTNELLDEHLHHHVLEAEDDEARRKGVEDLSSVLRSYLK
ncbi:metal/formaldehyde-sensitive transcriptional repressor [Sulfitobacter pontiacus]